MKKRMTIVFSTVLSHLQPPAFKHEYLQWQTEVDLEENQGEAQGEVVVSPFTCVVHIQ